MPDTLFFCKNNKPFFKKTEENSIITEQIDVKYVRCDLLDSVNLKTGVNSTVGSFCVFLVVN